jgi:Tfp pilus assembly protein PilF
LRAERETALETFKVTVENLMSERDTARAAPSAKDVQIEKQAGHIYCFRAELFRLKGDLPKARKMYEKAVEMEPENTDYVAKLDAL